MEWQSKKLEKSAVNGNLRYENGDILDSESFNRVVEGVLWVNEELSTITGEGQALPSITVDDIIFSSNIEDTGTSVINDNDRFQMVWGSFQQGVILEHMDMPLSISTKDLLNIFNIDKWEELIIYPYSESYNEYQMKEGEGYEIQLTFNSNTAKVIYSNGIYGGSNLPLQIYTSDNPHTLRLYYGAPNESYKLPNGSIIYFTPQRPFLLYLSAKDGRTASVLLDYLPIVRITGK